MLSPKPYILAHRGFWKNHPENSLGSFQAAFEKGFGVELDIWQNKEGEIVVSHDEPKSSDRSPLLYEVFGLMKKNDVMIPLAIHLKDWESPNVEKNVCAVIPKAYLDKVFLFDMPLETCRRFKRLEPLLKLGVSVGDKKYHPYFYDLEQTVSDAVDVIWADEYRNLYTKDFIEKAKSFGKKIYAISPDLAAFLGHPRGVEGYEQTWRNLWQWGVDGICTDKPEQLDHFLKGGIV